MPQICISWHLFFRSTDSLPRTDYGGFQCWANAISDPPEQTVPLVKEGTAILLGMVAPMAGRRLWARGRRGDR